MKKPKVEKLPSGNYRARLQINGTRYSATGATKDEARDKIMRIYFGFKEEKKSSLTVGKAMDNYISEREGTLSPSTIKGYRAIRRSYLQSIMDINLDQLSQSDIQLAVSQDATDGKSPKTIRNAHGLLTAVLKEFRHGFVVETRLPQKQKKEIRIFSEAEMAKVWAEAKGTEWELPILLGSWLGLRMSEIRGLKFCDICDGRIHICRARVKGPNGDVEKAPKTVSGDRWIKLPKEIYKLIHERFLLDSNHYICPQPALTIYKNFVRICKKAGVEPCRFHDLRHFAASESLLLGVPDKYSMKRMGHATDNMLKTVYQHTQEEAEEHFSDMIDEKMRDIYKNGHGNGHENKKV